jgi:hypothetical protein
MSMPWCAPSSPMCARAATRRWPTTRRSSTGSIWPKRRCGRRRRDRKGRRGGRSVGRRGAAAGARPYPLASQAADAEGRSSIPMPDRRELGSRWTAVEAVGLYVPGGTASYPSSVLMNAVPAKVAGVERIVMVVPARDGRSIRWCCRSPHCRRDRDLPDRRRAGVAALAYGTETIRRSPRSSGRAMPMWPPPSARSSARSAST